MKAKEVLQKLNITRPTLTKYVKEGLVKVDSVVNGQYHYNDESIYNLLNNKNEAKKEIKAVQSKKTEQENRLINCLSNLVEVFDIMSQYNALPPEAVNRVWESKKILKSIKKD